MKTQAQQKQRAEAELVLVDLLNSVPAHDWGDLLAAAVVEAAKTNTPGQPAVICETVERTGERIARAGHFAGRG